MDATQGSARRPCARRWSAPRGGARTGATPRRRRPCRRWPPRAERRARRSRAPAARTVASTSRKPSAARDPDSGEPVPGAPPRTRLCAAPHASGATTAAGDTAPSHRRVPRDSRDIDFTHSGVETRKTRSGPVSAKRRVRDAPRAWPRPPGDDAPSARPWATAHATRTPVNAPGPAPNAIASRSVKRHPCRPARHPPPAAAATECAAPHARRATHAFEHRDEKPGRRRVESQDLHSGDFTGPPRDLPRRWRSVQWRAHPLPRLPSRCRCIAPCPPPPRPFPLP